MEPTKTVDAYIATADPAARPLLEELRRVFKEAVPGAEEKISYNVPFYKYHGELGGFAVYKQHVSVGFGSGVLDENGVKNLEKMGYKLGKGTLQVRFDQKLPAAEIADILKEKAGQNEAKKK